MLLKERERESARERGVRENACFYIMHNAYVVNICIKEQLLCEELEGSAHAVCFPFVTIKLS